MSIPERPPQPPYLGALSTREIQVLQSMAYGCTSTSGARALHISPNTFKTHVRHVLDKLKAPRRENAVYLGYLRGWLPRPAPSPPMELEDLLRQTLRLISQGLSTPQIADALNMTEGSVKYQVHRLYDIFGVRNRAELITACVASGTLRIPQVPLRTPNPASRPVRKKL